MMHLTVGQLRSVVREAYDDDEEDDDAIRAPTWVKDVFDAVEEEFFSGSGDDGGKVYNELGRLLERLGLGDVEAYDVIDAWVNEKDGGTPVTYHESNRFRTKFRLVSGRDEHGNIELKDHVFVRVSDMAGHIACTDDEKTDAVWVFDPETLELDHVPTVFEVARIFDRRSGVGQVNVARLGLIEGGSI